MLPIRLGLILGLCLSVMTVLADGVPVALSKADKNRLEHRVCKSTFNLAASKINAFRFAGTDETRTLARVECQSHGTFNNHPMRYIDECDLIDGQWDCSPPQLEIMVDLNGRQVKMRPWGLTPETASTLLVKIGSQGYFQGESLDQAVGSSCDVGTTKDPEVLELKCAAVIRISFWCPQSQLSGCPRILFVSHDQTL